MSFLNRLKKVEQLGESEPEFVARRRVIARELREQRENLAEERARIESLNQRLERLTLEIDVIRQDLEVAVANKNRVLTACAIGNLNEADLAPARDRVALLKTREQELSELIDAVHGQYTEATSDYPQSKETKLTNNLPRTARAFWGSVYDELRHVQSNEEHFSICLQRYWAAYQGSARGNLQSMCLELLGGDPSLARAEEIRREMEHEFMND